MDISQLVKQRILILDGAIGTMIQGYGLSEGDFRGRLDLRDDVLYVGNNDMLCLTRPDIVQDIHRRYLEAGADMIETNTFSSQRISQADYHLEHLSGEMALAGARLAREMADRYATAERPRFVLGSIGPTNRTCSMSPDVADPAARDLDYDTLLDAYMEQVDALAEGGVDAFLIETIFDTLNAKAAMDERDGAPWHRTAHHAECDGERPGWSHAERTDARCLLGEHQFVSGIFSRTELLVWPISNETVSGGARP